MLGPCSKSSGMCWIIPALGEDLRCGVFCHIPVFPFPQRLILSEKYETIALVTDGDV